MPSSKTSRLTRLLTTAALALLLSAARGALAQQAGDSRTLVTFAPDGESFSVLMPAKPSVKEQPFLGPVASPAGKLYAASGRSGVEYRVWSLKSELPAGADSLSVSDEMDACAEMTWTVIVWPELESAVRAGNRDAYARYSMTYVRTTTLGTTAHVYYAREYSVSLGARRGGAYLFSDGARAYVALALSQGGAGDADVRTFLDSFTVRAPGGQEIKLTRTENSAGAGSPVLIPPQVVAPDPHPPTDKNPHLPTPATIVVDPVLFPPDPRNLPYGDPKSKSTEGGAGSGRGGNADTGAGGASAAVSCDELNKEVFAAKSVTRKAQVISRPEPTYTDWARRFSVTGIVRLRGVLSADGTVTNIVAVTRLPHGLTRKAFEAFRAVRFEPALKDGCKVSQYATIDYNFNIY